MESKHIFDEEQKNNLLFSNIKVDPSVSPFIKSRFEISAFAEDYAELLKLIKGKNIRVEEFKVEYLILDGDDTGYADRLQRQRDIGYSIEGNPDYYNPSIIYSICSYENNWYFGVLIKHKADWQQHNNKPYSFSNSIGINSAKALVNIASKGKKACTLLDACCGVGTIMLEACISGYDIEGCDLNWKACNKARANLAHYNYSSKVYRSDIKDLDKKYDAVIIDLPYNLYSYSSDSITLNIIEAVAKLTTRIVIVSNSDIKPIIRKLGLNVSDFCTVDKKGHSSFSRSIWVCENS